MLCKVPFEHACFAANNPQSASHGTCQVHKRRIQERPETSKKNLQFAVRHDVAVQSGSTKHPAAKNTQSACHGGLSRPPEELQERPDRGRKWPEAGAVQRLTRSCCARQVQEAPCSKKQRFCMPRWAQQASRGAPREAREKPKTARSRCSLAFQATALHNAGPRSTLQQKTANLPATVASAGLPRSCKRAPRAAPFGQKQVQFSV